MSIFKKKYKKFKVLATYMFTLESAIRCNEKVVMIILQLSISLTILYS